MLDVSPADIYCGKDHCFGKNACSNYESKIPALELTLSGRIRYTIPGHKLVKERNIVVDNSKYHCELLLFNSGDHYLLGSIFLEDYYSIYDIDNFKIGLGKVVDFEPVDQNDEAYDSGSATHEKAGDGSASEDSSTKNDNNSNKSIDDSEQAAEEKDSNSWQNLIIFSGCTAAIFLIVAIYCCKRRRDV